MGDQWASCAPKLIVCGVHVFKEERFRAEREAWENAVLLALPEGVDAVFIPLSLTAILNQPYDDVKGRLRRRIRKIHSRQNEYLLDLGNFMSKNTFNRVFHIRPLSKGKSWARYMIIADELAAWMVKDLMLGESNFYKETVALVFRGMRMPDSRDTEVSQSSEGSIKDPENLIHDYLIQLRKDFNDKADERFGQEGGLRSELVQADAAFSKLSPPTLQAVTWQIITNQRCNQLTQEEIVSVVRDLRKLVTATLQALQESRLSDSIDTVRERVKKELGDRVTYSQAKRSCTLPVGTEDKVILHIDKYQADNQASEAMKPASDLSGLSPELFSSLSSMRKQAISYFFANNLKNADRLFSAYSKYAPPMSHQSEKERLEIDLYHGVTCLHLGRYHEARDKLRKALTRAEELGTGHGKENDNSPATDIRGHLLLWYSAALMRIGDYRTARDKLEQLVRMTKKNVKAEGSEVKSQVDTCQTRYLQVRIKAHQILSIIRSHTEIPGSPEIKSSDQDLQLSQGLLERFQNEFPEILKQHQTQTDYVEREHKAHSSKEQPDFIRRMYAQEPDMLRTEQNLALSQVLIFRGDLERARQGLESVFRKLKEWLGLNHVLTLESQVLLAGLLVNTSRVMEGKKLAAEARDRIAQYLGESHPFAMDATYVLIVACVSQGREEEALRASQGLCREAERNDIFGVDQQDKIIHPRFSRYYTQLSDTFVAVGCYKEAENCLEDKLFQGSTAGIPIVTLARNSCHLAWALLHLGKYHAAKSKLCQALQILSPTVSREAKRRISNVSLNSTDLKQTWLRLSRDLSHWSMFQIQERGNATSVHPDILFTLQVCSELELRESDADIEFVLDTRKTLCTSLQVLLGEDSAETLKARLAWGHAMNACGHTLHQPTFFRDAFDEFEQVFTTCGTEAYLYHDHPLSLEANRELWLSKIMLGQISDTEVEQSVEVLKIVMSRQQRSLGPYRTQTLQTGLCHLSATLAVFHGSSEKDAQKKEAEDLLEGLRDPRVQQQRLVESLLMGERLAQICFEAGLDNTFVLTGLLNPDRYVNKEEHDSEIYDSCREIFRRASRLYDKTGMIER